MKIRYSPQRNDEVLEYHFNNEKIQVTLSKPNEKFDEVGNATFDLLGQETFDFSQMPDGVMEKVETDLFVNPIISAIRENGVLHVELLRFIKAGELISTNWQEVNNE